MQGIPNTAVPSTKSHTVSKGLVMVAELDPATDLPGPWRDIGSIVTFNMTPTVEVLKHISQRDANGTIDNEVDTSKETAFTLTVDSVNMANLKYFFYGTPSVYVNPAIAGFTGGVVVASGGTIQKEIWYDLVDDTGVKLYNVTSGNLTLKTTNATPVTLVEGTDYVLNLERGLVYFKQSSTAVDTAITGSEGITLDATADATAANLDEIAAQTKTSSQQRVAIRFHQVDKINNIESEIQIHKTTLTADGDLPFITDEWQEIALKGTALENIALSPSSPTVTVRRRVA